MAFIIYHLENGISRLFGYSSYVFNFFYLAYFTLVAFFTFEYVYNIYSLTIPFDSINLRPIHAFAEILEQEDILISVRNLYTSEPNYGIEFYPILPRLKSDQLPQTVPEMLSLYKKFGPHSTSESSSEELLISDHPPPAVTLMAPLARNLMARKSIL